MSNHTHHTPQAVKYGRFACFYSLLYEKMKARITDKEARECVSFAIGYCEAQDLLRSFSPVFYTCGLYGRKSDIYNINGVYIATGYGPVGKHMDYKTLKKYENKASEIWSNYDLDYEKRKKKVEKLLYKLIETQTK